MPASSADAITLHHVIEHVPDPIALLRECARILRPGGKLAVATPNVESLGHRLFGRCWLALDPPRHLHLFSMPALRACVRKAGLQVRSLRSTACASRSYYIFSHALRQGVAHLSPGYSPTHRVAYQSWAFLALEEALRFLEGNAGEELILIATHSG